LTLSRRTYEGFPRQDSSDRGRNRSGGPHDLRLFVRDTSRFVRPLLCSPPAGKPARGERGSSHGVFQRSSPPASVSHVRTVISLPKIQSRVVAHPSSRSCQTPRAIRPCRSSRLRRFTPCDPLQVYCTLQPVLRFAPFLPFSVIAPTRLRAVRPTLMDFPGSAVFLHTLQSFPLVIRRTASPRPLPSRRFFRSASRLCSSDKSVVLSWCCHQTGPVALLGFVPLQGSPLSLSLQAECPTRTRSYSDATIAGAPVPGGLGSNSP
jgi:hypothetical protein